MGYDYTSFMNVMVEFTKQGAEAVDFEDVLQKMGVPNKYVAWGIR